MTPVNYTSHPDGSWSSTLLLPTVAVDGKMPPAITGALEIAQHAKRAAARAAALELVRHFLADVCDLLAEHRTASLSNRAELDRLRHQVHGAELEAGASRWDVA